MPEEWRMEIRRVGGMCGMSGMRWGMSRMTFRHHQASTSCLLTNIPSLGRHKILMMTPRKTKNTPLHTPYLITLMAKKDRTLVSDSLGDIPSDNWEWPGDCVSSDHLVMCGHFIFYLAIKMIIQWR